MKSEFRKLLFHKWVWVLLVFTVLAQLVVSWRRPENRNYNTMQSKYPEIYAELVQSLEGELTAEKITWAEAEKERLNQINDSIEAAYQAYREGSGNYSEYRRLLSENRDILERIRVYDSLYEQLQQVKDIPGTSFVEANSWLQLFGDEISAVGILTFLFLVLFLTPFYVVDVDSHMDLLLRTSRRGGLLCGCANYPAGRLRRH